jgi:hypothetical protein
MALIMALLEDLQEQAMQMFILPNVLMIHMQLIH